MSAVQLFKRATGRIKKDLVADNGVVLLVLVVALLVVAGAFLATKFAMNASNTLERVKSNASATKQFNDAILAYVQSAAGGEIPCPDSTVPPNGSADEDGSNNCISN